MGKYVSNSHILGERGVIKFADYCNRHSPYLLWREEAKNDFGIDGEVELTKTNELGQREAAGKILKLQLKSTGGASCKDETDESFKFYARKEDLEYWCAHEVGVVLVIYSEPDDALYAKKIEKIDIAQTQKTIPIAFSKKKNMLDLSVNNFFDAIGYEFQNRVNFDIEEMVASNIFPFMKLPRQIVSCDVVIKDKDMAFKRFPLLQRPLFLLENGRIYSFEDIQSYKEFCHFCRARNFEFEKSNSPSQKMRFIKLTNVYLNDFFRSKGVFFSHEKKLYYFSIDTGESLERHERGLKSRERIVVKKYAYGDFVFFKHLGFEVTPCEIGNRFSLVINATYFFTEDGRTPHRDRENVFKYKNYILSREFNCQTFNNLRVICGLIFGNNAHAPISERRCPDFILGHYSEFRTGFGIVSDRKTRAQQESKGEEQQRSLF